MSKPRLGILLSGRGSNFEAIARNVSNGTLEAEIAVVISDKPEAPGLATARALGLKALALPAKGLSREEHDRQVAEVLKQKQVDLICLAGYMRLLGKGFISQFENRILNIHPSLLPSFAGLDAQRQALDHGVKVTGCTVHIVTEQMDAGPILRQQAVPVLPDDTVETLSQRILEQEHVLYTKAIQDVLSQSAGDHSAGGRA